MIITIKNNKLLPFKVAEAALILRLTCPVNVRLFPKMVMFFPVVITSMHE